MNLTEMPDEEYARIVDTDIRQQASQQVHDDLREKTPRRWRSTLIRMKKDIEWQITNNQAARAERRATCQDRDEWLDYLAEQDRWRANTLRVLKGIELCLAEPVDKHDSHVIECAVVKSAVNEAIDLLSIGEDDTDNEAIEVLNDLYEDCKR